MSSCPGESVKIYKTVKTDSFLNPAAASLPPHILVLEQSHSNLPQPTGLLSLNWGGGGGGGGEGEGGGTIINSGSLNLLQ